MTQTRYTFLKTLAALTLAAGLLAGQNTLSPADDGSLFFIQMSDPQFGMITENRDFLQETANLEFAIATANRLKPRFVIVTGDLVNRAGDARQIAEYHRVIKKLDPAIHVYAVPGNHDLGNVPTTATLAEYRKHVGPDYYSFQEGPVYGIVLDSILYHSPQGAPQELERQQAWLAAELKKAQAAGAAQIIVFQHHPMFISSANEPDQYFNIPLVRRAPLMAQLQRAGVRWIFCGHLHRNAEAQDGQTAVITTGAVGKPLGGGKSGIRLIWINGRNVTHRYAEFGNLPNDARRPAQ